MKRYGLALLFAVLFCLAVGVWGVRGALACPRGCPTGTPWLETQYPSETPLPTATWVTPTSPPPATDTSQPSPTAGITPFAEITPESSETPAPTPGGDDGEDDPATATVVATLPVTGGGPVGSWQLTVVGVVLLLGVAFLARMVRRATR